MIFTHINLGDSHEEGVISMFESHVVGRNADHTARVPYQLTVGLALRLCLVLDALQNAVHRVPEGALLIHQQDDQKIFEPSGNKDQIAANRKKKISFKLAEIFFD